MIPAGAVAQARDCRRVSFHEGRITPQFIVEQNAVEKQVVDVGSTLRHVEKYLSILEIDLSWDFGIA
jgi:hypothetical protein